MFGRWVPEGIVAAVGRKQQKQNNYNNRMNEIFVDQDQWRIVESTVSRYCYEREEV